MRLAKRPLATIKKNIHIQFFGIGAYWKFYETKEISDILKQAFLKTSIKKFIFFILIFFFFSQKLLLFSFFL
jgi:hypothetical protein